MTTLDLSVVLGALAAIGLVNWWFFLAGRTVAAPLRPAAMTAATAGAAGAAGAARAPATGEVVIVVDGGYTPNTVRVRAGEPLRLVFDRRDDSSCSEEVVIPSLGIRRFLPTGTRTAIELTPTDAGRIPFTCGMGMLKGTILVDAG